MPEFITSKVECSKCHQYFTLKFTDKFITIKCYCGVLILYKNRNVRFVSNEEYKAYKLSWNDKSL